MSPSALSLLWTVSAADTLILSEAWEKWGSKAQIDVLIEELAELTQALLHARRKGAIWSPEAASEIADVVICLQQIEAQMRRLEYADAWDRWVAPIWREKMDRLREREEAP